MATTEHHPRCTVMQSRAVTFLLTKLRQKDLDTAEFQIIGDRLMRLLGEEALARLPTVVEGEVDTPCGVAQGKKKYKCVFINEMMFRIGVDPGSPSVHSVHSEVRGHPAGGSQDPPAWPGSG